MPVILNAGTEDMKTWLDPGRKTWSKELQSLLKPYEGELECYQVPKDVGKVGNNSPDFIVPFDSKENKSNIANFFANAQTKEEKPLSTEISPKKGLVSPKTDVKVENDQEKILTTPGIKREHTPDSSSKETKKAKLQTPVTSQKMKTRSATSNISNKKPGAKKPTDGSQRITNFFK